MSAFFKLLLFVLSTPIWGSRDFQEDAMRQDCEVSVRSSLSYRNLDPVSSLSDLKQALKSAEDIGSGRVTFMMNKQIWFMPRQDYLFLSAEGGKHNVQHQSIVFHKVERDASEKQCLKLRFYYSVFFSSPYIQRDDPVVQVKLTGFFKAS